MKNRILLVDVGTDFISDAVSTWRRQGFTPDLFGEMEDALKKLQNSDYYLIMLTMRRENREEIINHLPIMRDMTNAPVAVLSTENDAPTKINTLNYGADDYTLIPCTIAEGVATGLALIRRYTSLNNRKKKEINLVFERNFLASIEHRKVFVKGEQVDLSFREFELLKFLLENRGKPFSYAQIFRQVWGEEYADSSKAVLWTQIKRLREKLHVSPELPEYIRTVRNYGYCFDPRSTG